LCVSVSAGFTKKVQNILELYLLRYLKIRFFFKYLFFICEGSTRKAYFKSFYKFVFILITCAGFDVKFDRYVKISEH